MKPAERMAADLDATVLKRTAVAAIDLPARCLRLEDGRELAWHDLVLALGADPIRLPLEGDAAAGVLSVNDLDDYARFADRLPGVRRVAILGAGLIGCEFANDLLSRGIAPVVIDIADRPRPACCPLRRRALRERLEAAGGISASLAAPASSATATACAHAGRGSTLAADLVLSAIGCGRASAWRNPRPSRRRAASCSSAARTFRRPFTPWRLPEWKPLLPFVLPLMQQARALAATLAVTPRFPPPALPWW